MSERPDLLFSNLFCASDVWLVPLFHPLCEVAKKRVQFVPLLGKRVFYSRGSLREDFSLDDLSLVQLVQPLGEACGAYSLYPPLQLVESCWLLESEGVYDWECPY